MPIYTREPLKLEPPSLESDESQPSTPIEDEIVWTLGPLTSIFPGTLPRSLENESVGNGATTIDEETLEQTVLRIIRDPNNRGVRRAVIADLIADDRSSTASLSPEQSETSLQTMLESEEEMQQERYEWPIQAPLYRAEWCTDDDAALKWLWRRDYERGEVEHPEPHCWLVVPTRMKIDDLKGDRLQRDKQQKIRHGHLWLTDHLEKVEHQEKRNCGCSQQWVPYLELKMLTRLDILCSIQIEEVVKRVVTCFYDNGATRFPDFIGEFPTCNELQTA
ncbi:hypothetical protein HD553DRAFT_325434 [Filobasidium floriforme]|uniref:uncharacterized protein n=1 Tax=Filobasidium floriforme TaxID=5210 RepID=UPI001E8D5319|nr:uncharacterized protein HD553DRAFT_325434 [Filobasidium floriforme]KAH8081396.1 hypothetical protein HD553DRAFT_325434 [Filobasidium floriforme]